MIASSSLEFFPFRDSQGPFPSGLTMTRLTGFIPTPQADTLLGCNVRVGKIGDVDALAMRYEG
jgi:hypothetical protein